MFQYNIPAAASDLLEAFISDCELLSDAKLSKKGLKSKGMR
jgi:hypothetical protein